MASKPPVVYVVQMGEYMEGASVTRLFYSHEGAMKCAESLMTGGVVEGEWEDRVDDFQMSATHYGYWVRGCDWVHVFLSEVEK
jgi:hypothetical protein